MIEISNYGIYDQYKVQGRLFGMKTLIHLPLMHGGGDLGGSRVYGASRVEDGLEFRETQASWC